MEKYNSTEKEWIKSLGSTRPELITSTLYEIRNSGSVSMLPFLIELIHSKTDPGVRNGIIELLGEIRNKEAIPILVESLENHAFGEYLPAFVAACWQSGLDFSKHMRVFANLFIHADYITALEAFTVLEESIVNATDSERIECIHWLRDSEYLVSDEKLPLYRELRKVIEES